MKTQCPNCKAKFNVNEKNTGKKTKCPHCAQPFTIEPFVMTPLTTPAATPVKIAEQPVAIPAKNAEPVKAAGTPVATPAKSEQPPVKTDTKVTEPVKAADTPVKTADKPEEEKPESKKLSKMLYVYCWAGAQIIAGIFGLLGLMLALRKGANSTLIAIFAAGNLFLVCSVLIELSLFYKMWNAIQDSKAYTSGAKAVGLLFIPVFNIYWALCMLTGFAEDYNSFIRRHSVTAKNLSLILFFVYAAAFILSVTFVTAPMVGILASVGLISRAFIAYPLLSWVLFFFALAAGIGHFIVYILFATKTCNAINALPDTLAKKN